MKSKRYNRWQFGFQHLSKCTRDKKWGGRLQATQGVWEKQLYDMTADKPFSVTTTPKKKLPLSRFKINISLHLLNQWDVKSKRLAAGHVSLLQCSPELLFQSESKGETILMKMNLICMKIKLHAELIFIWKVSHLDSFWNRDTTEPGNGLFLVSSLCLLTLVVVGHFMVVALALKHHNQFAMFELLRTTCLVFKTRPRTKLFIWNWVVFFFRDSAGTCMENTHSFEWFWSRAFFLRQQEEAIGNSEMTYSQSLHVTDSCKQHWRP